MPNKNRLRKSKLYGKQKQKLITMTICTFICFENTSWNNVSGGLSDAQFHLESLTEIIKHMHLKITIKEKQTA